MKPTRNEIESALDAGKISVRMSNGKLWRVRRNGMTQLWKTRPAEFRIPVKAGFRSTGEINHNSGFDFEGQHNGGEFVIHTESK
jgi:hypothetical protein